MIPQLLVVQMYFKHPVLNQFISILTAFELFGEGWNSSFLVFKYKPFLVSEVTEIIAYYYAHTELKEFDGLAYYNVEKFIGLTSNKKKMNRELDKMKKNHEEISGNLKEKEFFFHSSFLSSLPTGEEPLDFLKNLYFKLDLFLLHSKNQIFFNEMVLITKPKARGSIEKLEIICAILTNVIEKEI